jgi:hypothetical protein
MFRPVVDAPYTASSVLMDRDITITHAARTRIDGVTVATSGNLNGMQSSAS